MMKATRIRRLHGTAAILESLSFFVEQFNLSLCLELLHFTLLYRQKLVLIITYTLGRVAYWEFVRD